MTTLVKVAGANFSAAGRGFVAPVTGPAAWMLTGGTTLAQATRNLVDNSTASVVGAPVLNTGYLSLKGNTNYLQTAVPEVSTETTVVVGRSFDTFATSANAAVYFGTYVSSGDPGVSLLIDATATAAPAGRLKAIVGLDNSGAVSVQQPNAQIPDLSQWRCYALVTESGVGITIYDLQTGLTVATVASALPRRVSVRNYRIGSTASAVYTGTIDVAAWVKYNRALNASDRGLIYARLKTSLAKRGVTV